MRQARGPERRNFDSLRSWGINLKKGFFERRRKVERRNPELTEGSLEEFEALMKISKEKKSEPTEAQATGLDLLTGHL